MNRVTFIALSIADEYNTSQENTPKFRTIYEAALDVSQGSNLEKWCRRMEELIRMTHENMQNSSPTSTSLDLSRKLYSDSSILKGIAQFALSRPRQAIFTLDQAIIIAGVHGIERTNVILDTIRCFQSALSYDPSTPQRAVKTINSPKFLLCTIPCISPPSFLMFQRKVSQSPFILRKYASSWSALNSQPWRSAAYLRNVAGPARIVPVEIGADYRSKSWKQELMQWDDFLSTLDFDDEPASKPNANLCYLAQYDLTKQFPSLRDDIEIPDYVYASPNCSDFPDYHPPYNLDQFLLNTWLGPKGTQSPAHIDPYFNCYVQIVGYKSVWLAPPSVSSLMHSLQKPTHTPQLPNDKIANTSHIDVFSSQQDLQAFPEFSEHVVPLSITATLAPGDMLFFPPQWWHAMRSESTSFSISVWF